MKCWPVVMVVVVIIQWVITVTRIRRRRSARVLTVNGPSRTDGSNRGGGATPTPCLEDTTLLQGGENERNNELAE